MSLYDCSSSLHALQTSEELRHYANVQDEEPQSQQEVLEPEPEPSLMSKSMGVTFVNVGLLGTLVQTLHGVTDDQRVHAHAEYTVAEEQTEHTGKVVSDLATDQTQHSEIASGSRHHRSTIHNSDNRLLLATEGLSNKMAGNGSEIQIQRELICSLSAEIEHMRDHIESLQGRLAENNKIREALHELQRKEDSFKKQMKSMASELAHYKAVIKEQDIENKNLKRAKEDLHHVLIESEKLLCEKNKVIVKQEKEISYNHKTIEELHNRTNELKQTLSDLRQQLDLREEEIIISGPSDEYSIEPEINEQPERVEESSPPSNPAETVQMNETSRWHCYAVGTLVGVGFGITIVAIFACAITVN